MLVRRTDGPTDGGTDGRRDRRTDTTSYTDAYSHQKRCFKTNLFTSKKKQKGCVCFCKVPLDDGLSRERIPHLISHCLVQFWELEWIDNVRNWKQVWLSWDIRCILAICPGTCRWTVFKMNFMFLVVFCSNSTHLKQKFSPFLSEIHLVYDGQTDGRTHALLEMRERI